MADRDRTRNRDRDRDRDRDRAREHDRDRNHDHARNHDRNRDRDRSRRDREVDQVDRDRNRRDRGEDKQEKKSSKSEKHKRKKHRKEKSKTVHEKKGTAHDTNEQNPSRDKHDMPATTSDVEPKKRKKVHDRRKRRRGVTAPEVVATGISSPVKNSEPKSKDTSKAKAKAAKPVEDHPPKRPRLTERSKSKTSDTNKPKERRIISLSGISKSSSRPRPSILDGALSVSRGESARTPRTPRGGADVMHARLDQQLTRNRRPPQPDRRAGHDPTRPASPKGGSARDRDRYNDKRHDDRSQRDTRHATANKHSDHETKPSRQDAPRNVPKDDHSSRNISKDDQRRRNKDDHRQSVRTSDHRDHSGRGVRPTREPVPHMPAGRGKAATQPAWMNKMKNREKIPQPGNDSAHERGRDSHAEDRSGDKSRDRRGSDGGSDRHRDRSRDHEGQQRSTDSRQQHTDSRHGGNADRRGHDGGGSGSLDRDHHRDRGPDGRGRGGDYDHSDRRRSPPRHPQQTRRPSTSTSDSCPQGINPLYFVMKEIGLSRLAIERKLKWDGLSPREIQLTYEKLFHSPAQAPFPVQPTHDAASFVANPMPSTDPARNAPQTPSGKSRVSSISITVDAAEEAKRKKRAERFGLKKTEPEPEPSHGTEAQSDSVAQLLNSAAAEAYANPGVPPSPGAFPFPPVFPPFGFPPPGPLPFFPPQPPNPPLPPEPLPAVPLPPAPVPADTPVPNAMVSATAGITNAPQPPLPPPEPTKPDNQHDNPPQPDQVPVNAPTSETAASTDASQPPLPPPAAPTAETCHDSESQPNVPAEQTNTVPAVVKPDSPNPDTADAAVNLDGEADEDGEYCVV